VDVENKSEHPKNPRNSTQKTQKQGGWVFIIEDGLGLKCLGLDCPKSKKARELTLFRVMGKIENGGGGGRTPERHPCYIINSKVPSLHPNGTSSKPATTLETLGPRQHGHKKGQNFATRRDPTVHDEKGRGQPIHKMGWKRANNGPQPLTKEIKKKKNTKKEIV